MVFTHPLQEEWKSFCSPGNGFARTHDEFVRITTKYGYSILSEEAVHAIIALGRVVELGAGSGYNAKLITKTARERGSELVYRALDRAQAHWDESYFEIELGDVDSLVDFADHALFLPWPDGSSSFAFDAIRRYREIGGTRLAYVGEPESFERVINIDYDETIKGRMGCALFHQELREHWNQLERISVNQWPEFKDRLVIYEVLAEGG